MQFFEKSIKKIYTEWSKGRYTPVCVSKLPSKGLTIDYTVIVDLAPLTIAE